MKNIFKTGVMAIAAVAALSSCSDWTDPEPVDTTYQGIGEADPDTYCKLSRQSPRLSRQRP